MKSGVGCLLGYCCNITAVKFCDNFEAFMFKYLNFAEMFWASRIIVHDCLQSIAFTMLTVAHGRQLTFTVTLIMCFSVNQAHRLWRIFFECRWDNSGTFFVRLNIERITVTSVFVQNLKLRPGAPVPLLVNTQLQEELHQLDLRHVPERSHLSDLRQVTHAQRIQEFLLLLAVCNTVVVSRHPHHDMVNLIICLPI